MATEHDPVSVLSEAQAWERLAGVTLGRLVTAFGGQLEIFPVNFAVQDSTLLFRTAEGTKLFTTVMNDQVLFEVDDHSVTEGWSVVVRGTARMLNTAEEIREAESARLMPWLPTVKTRYVRIVPSQITARSFRFGPEPDDGTVPG